MNDSRRGPSKPSTRDLDQELASLAKALGHPARVRILRHLLASAECFCGELCEQLPLAQSTVSQHLKILKAAGLIQGTISRPRVCYCANPGRLREFATLLDELLRHDARKAGPAPVCIPGRAAGKTAKRRAR